jgi:MFS-type transporter involved in bile tolerance (Atg22 family)
MWDQYKKTFWGMQAVIAMVTAFAAFKVYRAFTPTALFFLVLQVGGVAGALWATSLKKRFQPHV